MDLEKIFNQQIANLSVLYFKLHHFHWFVQGKEFYIYHELYENLYQETTALIDQFAERLLAIKGTPVSTLKDFLALSSIQEGVSATCPVEISKILIADYSIIIDKLREGIKAAEDIGDLSSADMFIGIITDLEKHIWMFNQVIK